MDPASQPHAETSALERRLLDAARHDRIPDALSARMAEGLGLQLATAAPSASLSAGSKVGTPLLAKAGLWGALSMALVAGVLGWRGARHTTRDQSAGQADETTAGLRSPSPSPTPVVTPNPSPTPVVTPTPALVEHPSPARTNVLVRDDALRAEVALLDQARFALQAGQGARALRLLDQHRQRFTQGRLAPEAAALRIEALVQQGSYAQAEALSLRFATSYPNHPLRDRVSALGRHGSSQAQRLASPAR